MTIETYKTSATFNASFNTEAFATQKRTATLKLWISTGSIELVEDAMRLAKKHDADMVDCYRASLGLEKLSADDRKDMRAYFMAQKRQGEISEMPDRASRLRKAIEDVAPGKTVKGADNKFQDKKETESKGKKKRTAGEALAAIIGTYGLDAIAAAIVENGELLESVTATIDNVEAKAA